MLQTSETKAATIADMLQTAIARVEIEPDLAPKVSKYLVETVVTLRDEDEAHTKKLYEAILDWLVTEYRQELRR